MNNATSRKRLTYRCSLCKRAVEFQKLEDGTYTVVDAGPYVSVVTDDGEVVRGRTVHAATCPFAPVFPNTTKESRESTTSINDRPTNDEKTGGRNLETR